MADNFMKTLDGLTAIRFYAALWVFLFHVHLRLGFELPGAVLKVITNGAVAMPTFFMLSGLVLGYRYTTKYTNFLEYYGARVARIYPAYICSVLLCLPLFPRDAATAFFVFPVDLLLLQSWYPNLWGFWHHVGTWSISVEMFLYASLPLLLRLNTLSTRGLTMLCVGCVVLSSSWIPSLGVGASSDMPFPVFYSIPIYSLPVFVIGVALAELHRRRVNVAYFGWAPFVLLLLLALAGGKNSRYAALNFVMLPLIALTLLHVARFDRSRARISKLFINRVTIYLGDISYAFFVYQIPLVLLLSLHVTTAKALPDGWTTLLLFGVNVAMAAASHRWLEPQGSRVVKAAWQRLAHPLTS